MMNNTKHLPGLAPVLLAMTGMSLFLAGVACQPTPAPGPEPVCTTNADCNDNNVCTDDACVDGTCRHTNNTADCDDGDSCTTDDVCSNGQCVGTPVVCDEGEVCDPDTGQCVSEVPCTSDDDCDEGQVCVGGECMAAEAYETHKFDHEIHMATSSCETCHHEGNVGCDASGCHAEEWIGGVPSLKDAMHNPDGGCRSCHNDTTDDGLWDCSYCHTDF